jgi:hypothetical protein
VPVFEIVSSAVENVRGNIFPETGKGEAHGRAPSLPNYASGAAKHNITGLTIQNNRSIITSA